MGRIEYDEFGLFHENAQEHGLPFPGPPTVRRASVAVAPDRRLSALVWKEDKPELVFLHGGAQNAHTWDTVAMALDRPLVAIDLPGHGHSDGPGNPPGLEASAVDVATAVQRLAPQAEALVGMSLGGLTTIALMRHAPELVRKVILVDIVPGISGPRAKHIVDFVSGPPTFASLDELVEWTILFNPTRSVSSLRRGILHNAEQQEDGTWVWRWARHRQEAQPDRDLGGPELNERLWGTVARATAPVLLARGMRADSVLGDDDEAELLRRLPSARVVHIADAGHSLQGDTPLELAAIIEDFVFGG